MPSLSSVPNAQDAVLGPRCLCAVIDREFGRQIVGMSPQLISDPLIEIRCAGLGFGWHDKSGREWKQDNVGRWHVTVDYHRSDERR